MAYTEHFRTRTSKSTKTAQTKPIPGKKMVANSAGGYSFAVDNWSGFLRFLVLGAEGGTYYLSEKKLTQDNAKNTITCIKEDGLAAVELIISISEEGRAPKNDPAIFALALACTFGDADTKKAAYAGISRVCRIGTHIFQFCDAIKALRGISMGLKNGIRKFYTERSEDQLAYQLIKYQQRNGWTHADVLRIAHPTARNNGMNDLFKWAVGKKPDGKLHEKVLAFEEAKALKKVTKTSTKEVVKLINNFNLPREAIPTEFLNELAVWEALLEDMPLTAMIRNLGKMTSIGLLKSNLDSAVKMVVNRLTDRETLTKARIHPLNVLVASKIYGQGRGEKGSLSWSPVGKINEALDDAFYEAFKFVEPTGKNFLLGLDVSGSMTSRMSNLPLTFMEAAVAMAMVAVRTEPFTEIIGFDTNVRKIALTPKDTLEAAIKKAYNGSFGGTDCSLPMVYAQQNKLPVDAFCVYTDNETYAGRSHPVQALVSYRKSSGRSAKSVVFGMAANSFTIADPNDAGMLDVVGFDTAVPEVLAAFVRD